MQSGETIPLALLSSVRWHRELIPGLSCVSPSTAPSRVSKGPPWQIYWSMWPSQHPPGGVHNPTMLHLPSVQVAPLAPHWLSVQLKRKLLHTLAARVWKLFVLKSPQTKSSSMLVNCTSRLFSSVLLDSWHLLPSRKPWFLSWSADRQAAKPRWLSELHGSFLRLQPEWKLQFLHVGSSKTTIHQRVLRVSWFSCKPVKKSRPDFNIQTVRSLFIHIWNPTVDRVSVAPRSSNIYTI